jgi:hypothetical protein
MSCARMSRIVILLLVTAVPAAAAAEPLTHLVAGRATLHALRGNTIVSFDAAGRELSRCNGFEPPPERAARSAAGAIDADAALVLAGLPDDDPDSAEAEDALADEGLVPRRSVARAAAAAVVARALAAAPATDDLWIATSAGLYRGRDGACRRMALGGRDVLAVSAARDGVVVATADLVWRAGTGTGSPRAVAGLTLRPRAVAAVDDRWSYVADDDGVVEIGPYGATRRVLDQAAGTIVVCGGVVLALARDGAYRWAPGEAPARVGDRPPARALACGPDAGTRFIASGDGLYTSSDGSAWDERIQGRGRIVGGAATVGGRVWLARDGRLVALDPDAPRAGRDTSLPPRPSGMRLAGLDTGRLFAPPAPWPQVSVIFAAQRTPLRFGWSVTVLFAFPLERAGVSGGDRRRLAAEWVERDAAFAAEAARQAASEEGAALADLVLQEREALR